MNYTELIKEFLDEQHYYGRIDLSEADVGKISKSLSDVICEEIDNTNIYVDTRNVALGILGRVEGKTNKGEKIDIDKDVIEPLKLIRNAFMAKND